MVAYALVFAAGFIMALVLVPLVGAVAVRVNAVDVPGERTRHPHPVPRIGGLAILLAFLTATGYARWQGLLNAEQSTALAAVLVGGTLLALGGLLHDIRGMAPLQKFAWQFVAAAVAVALGLRIRVLPLLGLGLALPLLYLIGGASSLDLLDGMDGLSAGCSLIAALGLAAIGAVQGNTFVAVLAIALAGSVLGFLPFNFPRARISLGDIGSLFLGFTLAALGILLADGPYDLLRFAVPLVVLGVPLLDTGLALARRLRRQNHVFGGDREHSFDILARRLGDTWAVVAMWGGSALLGGAAVAAAWLGGWPAWAVLAAASGIAIWLVWASGMLACLRTPSSTRTPVAGQARPEDDERSHSTLTRLRRRYLGNMLQDLSVTLGAYYLALILRLSGDLPGQAGLLPRYARSLSDRILFVLVVHILSALAFRLYSRVWRFASSHEVVEILGAVGTATAVIVGVELLEGGRRHIPVGVVLIGAMLTSAGFVATRYRERLISSLLWRLKIDVDTTRNRALIVGAGEAGQLLAWSLQHQGGRHEPVGFVDDDAQMQGMRIHGVEVLGTTADIPRLVERHRVDLVVIAIHRLSRRRLNEVFDICQDSDARIQVLPDVLGSLERPNGLEAPRDMTIDDLLGRPTRDVDEAACRSLISGRVVLVTGAAGSIGSELCRQIARREPAQLLAVDRDETGLFNLDAALGEEAALGGGGTGLTLGDRLVLLIGDVCSEERMRAIWAKYQPDIVFHCAAYKHVPLLETSPGEAVRTNILGTLVPACLSYEWGTERFILVSTDKAACPVSVMGASKRVAELLVMALQGASNGGRSRPRQIDGVMHAQERTMFGEVRFGNVLGSRGSVVPTLEHQIDLGGPVTITDARMKRYFLSIPEAVSLIIQAGAYTVGGDLFVLDMGDEVSIESLARKIIRLRGLRVGEDIDIKYTGIRPGEKLSEVLFCPMLEGRERTRHPAIHRVNNYFEPEGAALVANVFRLVKLADEGGDDELRDLLFETARLVCPHDCSEEEGARP